MNRMFKIVIKSVDFYVGKLKANTFFGAFCCAYKDAYGEDDLVHFLHKLSDGDNELTFSSAFKAGYVAQRIDRGSDLLVKIDTIGSEKEEVTSSIPSSNIYAKSKLGQTNEVFAVERSFEENSLEVYVVTSLSKEVIRNIMSLAVQNGLAGRKSTGNGMFELVKIEEVEFDTNNKNGFVALGDFIPDSETPITCDIQTTLRVAVNTQGRKQKDLLLLKEGSVFMETKELRLTYGKIIHDSESNSYINCKTIAFPIRL